MGNDISIGKMRNITAMWAWSRHKARRVVTFSSNISEKRAASHTMASVRSIRAKICAPMPSCRCLEAFAKDRDEVVAAVVAEITLKEWRTEAREAVSSRFSLKNITLLPDGLAFACDVKIFLRDIPNFP